MIEIMPKTYEDRNQDGQEPEKKPRMHYFYFFYAKNEDSIKPDLALTSEVIPTVFRFFRLGFLSDSHVMISPAPRCMLPCSSSLCTDISPHKPVRT
jgi:hypothetical protein